MTGAVAEANLETNSAQVAQCPQYGRHCDAVGLVAGAYKVGHETSRSHAKSHDPFGLAWFPSLNLGTSLLERDHRVSDLHHHNFSMIIRTCIRARVPLSSLKGGARMAGRPFRTSRRYSTSGPASSTSVPQSQASMLATITTDLDKIAPKFEIEPEQIQILKTPAEFYETLKVSSITCFHLFAV
jgi:hypothetical protein